MSPRSVRRGSSALLFLVAAGGALSYGFVAPGYSRTPQAPLRSRVRMATATDFKEEEDEDQRPKASDDYPEMSAKALGREPGTCDPFDPKSAEYCSPQVVEATPFFSKRTLKLTALFVLWYALNVGYNIGNKLVLTALPTPWSSATWELFFGLPYVGFLWLTGLRKRPQLTKNGLKLLIPPAFFLACTHVFGVISFGAGAISFTHVCKATEPVWTALISALIFREFLPVPVYLSLIPIIFGVSLASAHELSFTWVSFIAATGSAVTSACKAILGKKVLDGKSLGKNLTPGNMFAVLTILGCFMILPASMLIEGPSKFSAAWAHARSVGYSAQHLWLMLSVSGFLYYTYNEVAFLALKEVAPVTHAVTNTVKRVVIIIASVVVFRTPMTPLGTLGSSLAIIGALLYSVAKDRQVGSAQAATDRTCCCSAPNSAHAFQGPMYPK